MRDGDFLSIVEAYRFGEIYADGTEDDEDEEEAARRRIHEEDAAEADVDEWRTTR